MGCSSAEPGQEHPELTWVPQPHPLTFAEELASGLPDAELVVLETGHTPVWEAPEEVRAALRGLWARV